MSNIPHQTLLIAERFYQLHPKPCYKLLTKDMIMRKFQWKEGRNRLSTVEPFRPKGYCSKGGLYFTDLDHIHCYLSTEHELIGEITVSPGTYVYTENGIKYKAHDVILNNVRPLREFFDEQIALTSKEGRIDLLARFGDAHFMDGELHQELKDATESIVRELVDPEKVNVTNLTSSLNSLFSKKTFGCNSYKKWVLIKMMGYMNSQEFESPNLVACSRGNSCHDTLADLYLDGFSTYSHLTKYGFGNREIIRLTLKGIAQDPDYTNTLNNLFIESNTAVEQNLVDEIAQLDSDTAKRVVTTIVKNASSSLESIMNKHYPEMSQRFNFVTAASLSGSLLSSSSRFTMNEIMAWSQKLFDMEMQSQTEVVCTMVNLVNTFKTSQLDAIYRFLKLDENEIVRVSDKIAAVPKEEQIWRALYKSH